MTTRCTYRLQRIWSDVLTGHAFEGAGAVALRTLLADFPVAVLAQPQR